MNKHTLVIAVAMAIAAAGVAQAGPTGNASQQGHPMSGNAQLSPAQRGALVAQIVRTWGPFVESVQGGNISVWASRMKETFAAASDANLQRAAGMKTFQGMFDALVGQHVTDAQVKQSLALQAKVLNAGVRPALLGSVSSDLVYTPLTPCRTVDTRVIGGPIASNSFRSFYAWNLSGFASQGGSATDCGVPSSATGVMLNITAVHPTAAGYLTVYPFGSTQPLASNLNYTAGSIVGNEIAAKIAVASSTFDYSVYAFRQTDLTVDVVGFFAAPEATPLDITDAAIVTGTATAGANTEFTNSCPTGYAITGGGCWSEDTSGNTVTIGNVVVGNTQFCNYHNYSGVDTTVDTYAHCVRVPGR